MELSIIVPVYNNALYLETAVNSLCGQQFRDIEIILIDDGSTDESGKICDMLEGKDSRIRVFHQVNKGVSAARNKGIVEACGKYLTFVDADDWVEQDAYTLAMGKIKEKSLDILVFGYTEDIGEIHKKKFYRPYREDELLSPEEALRRMLLEKEFSWNIGDKIYAAGTVKGIRFDEQIYNGEDLLFHWNVFSNAQRIGIFNTYKYHYVQNETSASHKALSLKSLSVLDVFPMLMMTASKSVFPAVETTYLKYCIGFSKRIKLAGENVRFNSYLQRAMKMVKENFRRILWNENIPMKHRLGAGFLFLPDTFWMLAKML